MRKYLILLIAIIQLGRESNSLAIVPTFQVTNKYVQAATFTLTTIGTYYNNSAWIGTQQTTFNIPYLISHATYTAQISFQELSVDVNALYQLNVTISRCGSTPTALNTCLYSTILNNLFSMRIRYILLQAAYTKNQLYTLYIYSTGTIINSNNPYISNFGLAMNVTGTMRTFLAFVGFNLTAPNSTLQYDLKASATFLSSTTLQLKIETTVVNNIIMNGVSFAFIGYNEELVASWPFPAGQLNYATFDSVGTTAVYTDTKSIIRDYNTFWGLTRLNINSQQRVQFSSDLTPMTGIVGTSLYPFNNLNFNVIVFLFKECDQTTPYYMQSNDTCYDICPQRYYEDSTDYLCKSCTNYACWKCSSSGICTSCSSTADFRVLNAGTQNCDPLEGYYDVGGSNPVAQPCISYCKTCSNSVTCTLCYPNYALDGSNICVGAFNCSVIQNCLLCTMASGCSNCSLGYNLINSTACNSVCGDGIKVASEACDDGNNQNGDGCSSNCTIESAFYCVLNGVMSNCSNCSLHCSACTTLINCQSCYNPYLLDNVTTSCVPNCILVNKCQTCHEINGNQTYCDSCTAGYQAINGTCTIVCGDGYRISPEECDDPNNASNDGCSSNCTFEDNSICTILNNTSQCSFCAVRTYADSNHSTCLPCSNYDCYTCTSTGDCLSCSNTSNRILNVTAKRCLPKDGFYDDTTNQLALPCSILCVTCTGAGNNTCTGCSSNKILVNSSCELCSTKVGLGCNNCSVSNSTIVCLSCTGLLVNGTCTTPIDLPSPEDASKLLLIILIPLLLALCCCCLVIFFIWRRRKNQENKVDEEIEANKQNLDANKPYKVDSKKLQDKIQVNETEGNELSLDEFKDKELNDVKVEIVKQKSQMNDNFNMSEESQSKQSQQSQDERGGRGCVY